MDSGMRVPHTVDRRETAISGALPAGPHAQQSWSRYWDGNAGKAPEQAISEGRFGPVLRRHWEAVFKNSAAFPENGRMLDLACGAGVVGRLARDRVGGGIDIVGVDLSSAAARQAETGLVGNIALLPFGPGCFDRIVSQFGIEYAGLPAFREAARVLTPAGQFSAVVHVKHGAIWRENATCLDIVQRTMDAGILHKCRLRLQTGYKLDRGAAAPAAFDRRTAAFEAAARAVLVALRDAADCAAKRYRPAPAGSVRYRFAPAELRTGATRGLDDRTRAYAGGLCVPHERDARCVDECRRGSRSGRDPVGRRGQQGCNRRAVTG